MSKLRDAAQQEPVEATPYNLKRIAWELERTALGDGFYGNALRVAKDIPGITPEDRSVLDRYATGTQTGLDHLYLQRLALRLYHKDERAPEAPQLKAEQPVEQEPVRGEWQGYTWNPYAVSQPKAEPLTDEEIYECERIAAIRYHRHKSSIRGQQITPADDPQWHFANAIIAAYERKNGIGEQP